jgi:hypothetical protein
LLLHNWWAGLPDFSWSRHTKKGKLDQMNTNYIERPKIYHLAVKYSKWS